MKRLLLLLAVAVALALPAGQASAIQCVAFARDASGIRLQGDAWQWWDAAIGTSYSRGSQPESGSILVFPRQGKMSHGHLSVVSRVVNSRMVLVDHANWGTATDGGRGQVTHSVPVLDVSPNNDWSQVRVWYRPSKLFGNRVYQTTGFVYGGHAPSHHVARSLATPEAPKPRPTGDEYSRSHPSTAGLIKVSGYPIPRARPTSLPRG